MSAATNTTGNETITTGNETTADYVDPTLARSIKMAEAKLESEIAMRKREISALWDKARAATAARTAALACVPDTALQAKKLISLCVGGKLFECYRTTLCNGTTRNSIFDVLFSGRGIVPTMPAKLAPGGAEGVYFFDRDPALFGYVMTALMGEEVNLPVNGSPDENGVTRDMVKAELADLRLSLLQAQPVVDSHGLPLKIQFSNATAATNATATAATPAPAPATAIAPATETLLLSTLDRLAESLVAFEEQTEIILREREDFRKVLDDYTSRLNEVVKLNSLGTYFITSRQTLCAGGPDSLLTSMFSKENQHLLAHDDRGFPFIQRTPDRFCLVLQVLRFIAAHGPEVCLPFVLKPNVLAELKALGIEPPIFDLRRWGSPVMGFALPSSSASNSGERNTNARTGQTHTFSVPATPFGASLPAPPSFAFGASVPGSFAFSASVPAPTPFGPEPKPAAPTTATSASGQTSTPPLSPDLSPFASKPGYFIFNPKLGPIDVPVPKQPAVVATTPAAAAPQADNDDRDSKLCQEFSAIGRYLDDSDEDSDEDTDEE